ncbi:hypothetical protein SESBI_28216 [Sesbania bispinosa]|nr:hypothetical protein SESBI_28216 [Sesbania bispinosa]
MTVMTKIAGGDGETIETRRYGALLLCAEDGVCCALQEAASRQDDAAETSQRAVVPGREEGDVARQRRRSVAAID